MQFFRTLGNWVSFCISLKLSDNAVSILGIILSNKSFNARRIKDGHIGFCGINSLTDWFGDINKLIKNKLQII